MNLKTYLFDDERGVSPVIGVILMVAITVILAAVIATFVMNMGPPKDQAPTANFNIVAENTDSDSTLETVTIKHTGGESVPEAEITISGISASASSFASGDTISAGDSVSVSNVASGTPVEVIWESQNTDKSDVLASKTV